GITDVGVVGIEGNGTAVGLMDTGVVEGELLVGRVPDDAAELAQVFDALATVEAEQLVGDDLLGAVGVKEVAGAGVKQAGTALVEEVGRHLLEESAVELEGGRLVAGTAGDRPFGGPQRQAEQEETECQVQARPRHGEAPEELATRGIFCIVQK